MATLVAATMKRLRPLVLLTAALLAGPPAAGQSAAARALPSSLDALDKHFACPETLPSDDARMVSLRAFFDAYARLEPGATPARIIAYRRLLLERHRCGRTLAHLDAADRAVTGGSDVRAQAWVPVDQHDGVALSMSASHGSPVVDPRLPDDRAVEAYARVTFATPMLTSASHVRYDEVVSRSVYFCRAHRYALIANTFFLAGRQVLIDAGEVVGHTDAGRPLYRLADIPGGSPNAAAAAWACDTDRAIAA